MSAEPAFPHNEKDAGGTHWQSHPGMTLRDWFAGQIAASMAGHIFEMAVDEGETPARVMEGAPGMAVIAYAFADAMLAARSKP